MTNPLDAIAPERDSRGRILEGQPLIRCAFGTPNQPRERGLFTRLVRDVPEARSLSWWRGTLRTSEPRTLDHRGAPVPVSFELEHLPVGTGSVAAMKAAERWAIAPSGAMPPDVATPPPRFVRVRVQIPGQRTVTLTVERDPMYETSNGPVYNVSAEDAFRLLQSTRGPR